MEYFTDQINKVDELLVKGEYTETVDLLEGILCDEPDNKEALWRIGIAFTELNEQKKALKALDYYFKFDKNHPEAIEAYGCSHFKLGNYGLAKKHLERAAELNSMSSSIARNLGVTYNQLGEFEKSYDSMAKSYQLNPWDYRTIYALASAHIFYKRYAEAEELLKELLQMDIPGDFKRLALEGRKKIETKLNK
ncbi:MAG: tetratricopeptide repeat protein [Spirochaetia bacterium]|jgi:tetratricopeptide (TPR) repeat protein|nr:tetratricopeptide repeat protein [Spirochaetia bacterium]